MRPWSYSRLGTWETCPRQYQYSYLDKLPSCRPPSPTADRGTNLHQAAEDYLKGELKIYPPEFQKVAGHLMLLKTKETLKPERKMAVTETWEPCEFEAPEAMLRAIIDVIYDEEGVVHVQDWKTGQVYDTHADQLSTYVAIAAAHYPEATEYRARAIYIDQGFLSKPVSTKPDRVKPIRMMLDGRIKNAEDDKIWPTRSGGHCRWCDHSARFGGPCAF